ncbi:hypothetical protein ACS0TY_003654 [Phlomoides rotata]
MELRCMQSPTFSSIPRSVLLDKPFLSSIVKLSGNKRTCPDVRRLKFLDFRVRASEGTAQIKSVSKKDGNLVFVAGATGKVGSRTVRELLKLGFKVRAGVRSIQRAEPLVQKMKLDDVTGATDKFEVVECDLEKPGQIRPALGNSSAVICCIGASEKEIFDITGPYRIDYQATKNLIDAATSAKVEYFILLTSLGTNKFGFPAAILNLFWGVLCWKRKAEEALLASNLPYAIVRPGGMERPTDSYKETHNITLSSEDTLFGGQVSNLQVAELIAFMTKNRSLSCCKIVEVIAETTAPLTHLGELLKKIPSQREDICNFKESDDAGRSQPIVLESTSKEKEPRQMSPTKATPLSPYAAYEDLKPPTSPTPTPSSGSTSSLKLNSSSTSTVSVEKVIPQTAPKKTNPSSPFINYEDLKPPSSPTPTPSGSKAEPSTAELTDVATIESSDAPIDSSTPLAIVYDDLKPPSSPSPSVPELSGPQKTFDEKTESGAGRPLSPYTMYEDMKPPSSPMPCLRN